jgi:hypothetical protein
VDDAKQRGVDDEGGQGEEGSLKRVAAAAAGAAEADLDLDSRSPRSRGENFGFVGEMSARWSDHYKANPREPENTELAWWVKGAMRGAK